ncbi:MAG: lytic transglycosylase domain-containing protein [Ferruginibacter sp.]
MIKYLYIIFLFFISNSAYSQVDTSAIDTTGSTSLIKEVIENRSQVPKQKVQYINQLTRYGFKNLFAENKYSATQPYQSQINPLAESYIQGYLKGNRSYLLKMKTWGIPYFNLIDNILSQYGLPRELKYLAVIESNLSTSATSWVGAGGPWQFMPYTARDYGLVVSSTNDERRDYFKSTHAAAKYLLSLYNQMHDWLLVIAAYNGGPGRVFDAMKKSGSNNFWALQYYLPEESRNHVKKFIATHYIMEEGDDGSAGLGIGNLGIQKSKGVNPYDVQTHMSAEEMITADTKTISGKYNGAVIAKNLAMDIKDFNRFNPLFDKILTQSGSYDLILPEEKMQLFMAIKYQILNECVQLLLDDNDIPNNKTVYPQKYSRKWRKNS